MAMVTKKVRSEYMKRFRDPKWETFSKCYEDSLKYRLTRRVMEHSHKPWFWEGWDSGSESSGWSTPRLSCNKVAPLPSTDGDQQPEQPRSSPDAKQPPEDGEDAVVATEEAVVDAAPPAGTENGGDSVGAAPPSNPGGASDDTDSGPLHSPSSDGEPVNPVPRRRHRRRTPHTDLGRLDCSQGDKSSALRKPQRAKSQPPAGSKENRLPVGRLDWTERHDRKTPNHSHMSDACVPTRPPDKHSSAERRRARSADLDKLRRTQLADERWMTEYMRCFSARIR
ncbi:centriole, cilia and spindle-associated protein isoform X2 [Dunckerocampus dactyliophorus]|uniref:centriole, cilia and spindle-associated protein isoform X2 n=1 Tax=Dunckerocampus dactyliophorus TaxID=161453 RepID=UPI0024051063|nr:centriole, cilia and spindle-associated protein isoform X2 [Dunckerocampus dactyliophorus]